MSGSGVDAGGGTPRVSSSTVSDLNQKIYGKIEEWRRSRGWGNFPTSSLLRAVHRRPYSIAPLNKKSMAQSGFTPCCRTSVASCA
jgi:hypothetical protein